MTIRDKLIRFIHTAIKQGLEIEWIPMSRSEIEFLRAESFIQTRPQLEVSVPIRFSGYNVWQTENAEAIREACEEIRLPCTYLVETALMDRDYKRIIDQTEEMARLRLERMVLSDTSAVSVQLICDPWRWIKERLPKWLAAKFPLRRETVTINARVLYPYVSVQLPYNRHHVTYAQKSARQ